MNLNTHGKLRNTIMALTLGAGLLAGSVLAQDDGDEAERPATPVTETEQFNANLMASLHAQPELTKFSEMLERAGLNHRLNDGGSYTLFALTNGAMSKLDELHDASTFSDFELQSIVHSFILDGAILPDELGAAGETDSLSGYTYTVDETDGLITVDGVAVNAEEVIVTENGVIYVLSKPFKQVTEYVEGLPATVRATEPADDGDGSGVEQPDADN